VNYLSDLTDEVGNSPGPFGLTGGVGSDGGIGGCGIEPCAVTGYWQNASSVPEPGSMALLLSALSASVLCGAAALQQTKLTTAVSPQRREARPEGCAISETRMEARSRESANIGFSSDFVR
jgi:hypothetical protein